MVRRDREGEGRLSYYKGDSVGAASGEEEQGNERPHGARGVGPPRYLLEGEGSVLFLGAGDTPIEKTQTRARARVYSAEETTAKGDRCEGREKSCASESSDYQHTQTGNRVNRREECEGGAHARTLAAPCEAVVLDDTRKVEGS